MIQANNAGALAGADIRAITLDLDDTLWPVLPTLIEAEKVLKQWLQRQAPITAAALDEPTRSRLRNAIVREHPERAHDMSWLRAELIRRALSENAEDPGLAEPAFDAFLAARQQVRCYDEVREVLAGWARQYRLVAISNGNADIARVGLGEFFHGAISAHEQDFAKPDRRMFEAAMAISQTTPAQTLHIGDDWEMDIKPAMALGMPVAWVRRPDLKLKPIPDDANALQVYENLRLIDTALSG